MGKPRQAMVETPLAPPFGGLKSDDWWEAMARADGHRPPSKNRCLQSHAGQFCDTFRPEPPPSAVCAAGGLSPPGRPASGGPAFAGASPAAPAAGAGAAGGPAAGACSRAAPPAGTQAGWPSSGTPGCPAGMRLCLPVILSNSNQRAGKASCTLALAIVRQNVCVCACVGVLLCVRA